MELFDINMVCRMLGTTSRTLRFYEEKQIITSTKTADTVRRQYTKEQVDLIRNVLVLRTLGLSVKDIAELQRESTDLKSALLSRRAQMYALIEEKNREINLLNEALAVIESGGDVYRSDWLTEISQNNGELIAIAQECAKAFVTGNSDVIFSYFSPKMKEYLPSAVYESVRRDTLEPLGEYAGMGRIYTHKKHPNVIFQDIRYQKLGLKVKFVFYHDLIHGLWFDYFK